MTRRSKRHNPLWKPRRNPMIDNPRAARQRRLRKAIRHHDYMTAGRLGFEAVADAMNGLRSTLVGLAVIADVVAARFAITPELAEFSELDEPYRLTPTHDHSN